MSPKPEQYSPPRQIKLSELRANWVIKQEQANQIHQAIHTLANINLNKKTQHD